MGKNGFAVDNVICPEASVTRYIHQLISHPEALQVLEFAHGRAGLIVVRATAGSALVNHTIGEFRDRFPQAQMRVVAIYRLETEMEATHGELVAAQQAIQAAKEKHNRFLQTLGLQPLP